MMLLGPTMGVSEPHLSNMNGKLTWHENILGLQMGRSVWWNSVSEFDSYMGCRDRFVSKKTK